MIKNLSGRLRPWNFPAIFCWWSRITNKLCLHSSCRLGFAVRWNVLKFCYFSNLPIHQLPMFCYSAMYRNYTHSCITILLFPYSPNQLPSADPNKPGGMCLVCCKLAMGWLWIYYKRVISINCPLDKLHLGEISHAVGSQSPSPHI